MMGLESSGMPSIRRSAAKQYIGRSSEKYNKREEYRKRYKEDIQNIERSMVKYRNRESRYTQRHNNENTLR